MQYKKIEKLREISKSHEIVFLCVGNPKIWYDSFGPLFGNLLKYLEINKFVYGDVKAPITSQNIDYYIECIRKFHVKPYIVVIDSALSVDCSGITKINDGGLNIACLSDNSQCVGDMGISYTINKKDINKHELLIEMLKEIKKLARLIKYVFSSDYKKCENM